MTKPPATTDVVIVGAGPTGLTLAAFLTAGGAGVVLLDRATEGAGTSRAAVVPRPYARGPRRTGRHPRAGGARRDHPCLHRPGPRPRAADRAVRRPAHQAPVHADGPQNVTEQVLLGRLRALGGQVHRPHEVTGVAQDATGVTVTTATGETVRAHYVVGADGMHSVVRERSGIGFAGDTYACSP